MRRRHTGRAAARAVRHERSTAAALAARRAANKEPNASDGKELQLSASAAHVLSALNVAHATDGAWQRVASSSRRQHAGGGACAWLFVRPDHVCPSTGALRFSARVRALGRALTRVLQVGCPALRTKAHHSIIAGGGDGLIDKINLPLDHDVTRPQVILPQPGAKPHRTIMTRSMRIRPEPLSLSLLSRTRNGKEASALRGAPTSAQQHAATRASHDTHAQWPHTSSSFVRASSASCAAPTISGKPARRAGHLLVCTCTAHRPRRRSAPARRRQGCHARGGCAPAPGVKMHIKQARPRTCVRTTLAAKRRGH